MLDKRPTLEDEMRRDATAYLEAMARLTVAKKRQSEIESEIRSAEGGVENLRMQLSARVGPNIRDRYISVDGRIVHVRYTGNGGKNDAVVFVGELL